MGEATALTTTGVRTKEVDKSAKYFERLVRTQPEMVVSRWRIRIRQTKQLVLHYTRHNKGV